METKQQQKRTLSEGDNVLKGFSTLLSECFSVSVSIHVLLSGDTASRGFCLMATGLHAHFQSIQREIKQLILIICESVRLFFDFCHSSALNTA